MSTTALLELLRNAGLRVWTDGEKVLLAPKAKVTAEVIELVRANKAALLGALSVPKPRPPVEHRRAQVERDLAEHPELRVAVDVAGAPLRSESGEPVSVVMACRTPGGVTSGELHISRERFDARLIFQLLEDCQSHSLTTSEATA